MEHTILEIFLWWMYALGAVCGIFNMMKLTYPVQRTRVEDLIALVYCIVILVWISSGGFING